jgi:hypothetical protein
VEPLGNTPGVSYITLIDFSPFNHGIISAPLILDGPNLSFIDQVYNEFGPTPRICFEDVTTPEKYEEYSAALTYEISKLTLRQLRMALDKSGMETGAESHKLFLIRRTKRADPASISTISPITDAIATKLVDALRRLE